MQPQANIVSFDAVRRRSTVQRRGASVRPDASRARQAGAGRGDFDEVSSTRSRVTASSAGRTSRSGSAAGAPRTRGDAAGSRSGGWASMRRGASPALALTQESFGASSRRSAADRSSSMTADGRRGRAEQDRFEDEGFEKKSLFGRMRASASEGRRARTKERAGKAYFRQYEKDKPSDASQGGPRAAVYKGEMGSTHKRSARMQQDGAGSRGRSAGSFAASQKRSRFRAPLTVLGACALCVAFGVAMLYGPAQQFYTELRERDRLAAEYQAVVERNEAISQQVAALQTDAGIEDRARTEFGWVKEGEHAVSVSGLEPKDSSTFRSNIVSEDIPLPDTWYSGLLDPLFGVEDKAGADAGDA
ncbi:septum formation initiator family protein [Adlercreutzia equolifaciens]|uniref:septum formation initiator family protein n=1 Tax=Adlercreutzia equolifaciens TaxID=446660 RepID=UPI0023B0352D|nr:septum formation initiator family protein [Adlercreutzia equolifaciens]MDE8702063.1 septum formation initiator family protein [Adlercreutzia equolifaciens]